MIVPGDMFEVGLIVRCLEDTIETLHKAFGYTFTQIVEGVLPTRDPDGDTQPPIRYAVSQQAPQLELIEAAPGTHLALPGGTGLHHIGYYVDDLAVASDALEALGMPLVRGGFDGDQHPFAWAYHEMNEGTLIELVDRQTAPMRTMITVGQLPASPWLGGALPLLDGWRPSASFAKVVRRESDGDSPT